MNKNVSALALAVSLAWAGPALAQEKAEVIHWWTSGGESAAVKVFADQFTQAGGTWVDTAIAGGANARTAASTASSAAIRRRRCSSTPASSSTSWSRTICSRDVDAIGGEQKWNDKSCRPAIVEAVTRNGKFLPCR